MGIPKPGKLAVRLLRRGGTVNFFGGCPNDSRSQPGHLICCTIPKSPARPVSITRRPISARRWISSSRGVITARDFVNRVEPLTNLLEVMRHLMSHNGHLKTAIIP